MSLFKATFSTFFEGSSEGLPDIEDCNGVKMFFEAQNINCAREIANAMIGETFCELERLYRVLDVNVVRRQGPNRSISNKNTLWWNTFRNLRSLGKEVKIILDKPDGDVVGIQFQ